MMFVAGLFLGCLIGLTITALCRAAKNADSAAPVHMPAFEAEFLKKAVAQR